MSRVLVQSPDGNMHRVEIVAVGLNWWIGTCRDCGGILEAKSTGRYARHFGYDGTSILLGRAGVQVWPGHPQMERRLSP